MAVLAAVVLCLGSLYYLSGGLAAVDLVSSVDDVKDSQLQHLTEILERTDSTSTPSAAGLEISTNQITVGIDTLKGSLPETLHVQHQTHFDFNGNDTLVFIHIQKTGGSNFLRHLVTLKKNGAQLCLANHSVAKRQTTKRQYALCPKSWEHPTAEVWLLAEKTVGWACGLHPFYTEFRSCILAQGIRPTKLLNRVNPRRNFCFTTILRHPVLRYLSEYFHVQRGATWSYRHKCGGREVTDEEVPPCYHGYYTGEKWENVSLTSFVSCEDNWANNRQTRMVADLASIGCFQKSLYTRQERDRLLLQSAKDNLEKFPYFGITEYAEESALLFEKTFGMEFGDRMEQKPIQDLNSAPVLPSLWNKQDIYKQIVQSNALDMELYDYALQLFTTRLKAIGVTIDSSKVDKEIEKLNPDFLLQRKKFSHLKYDIT